MKLASKWVFIGVITLSLSLAACGGGGGSGAPAVTGTSTGTTVAITGTLSAAASKPSSGKSVQLYAVSSWAGATLQVIDSAGTVVGTGTVNADGTYSVDVPTGSNYFIKVQIGNLVLKAFVPSVTAAATVNVNTTTTAEVMVLASVLGVANAGEPSVNTATAIAAVNMTTVMADIDGNANLATIAGSLATEIASSYDSTATTTTIGSASATVSGTVTTIAGTVSVSATTAAPSAPTGIGITAGDAQATISWTAVTGATAYNVYRGTAAGVTVANGTKTTGATSGAAITGLTNGTAYYFVVTAVNAGGESAVSSEVGATPQVPAPGAPTGVTVTAGNGQTTVSWTAVTGATSYNVYHGTAAGVTATNGTKTTGATSGAAITGLTNGTTYYFVVTAVGAGGESAVSSEVSATPQVSAPGTPTGVTVTAGNGQATVSWTAVSGATNYNVYYRTTTGVTAANGTKVTGVTSGGAITGLTNGSTYYLIVTAVNAGGESAASSEKSFILVMAGAVQKVLTLTGAVSTYAGNATGSTDATGAAARFRLPQAVATDGTNLYVADTYNNTIRKIVISSGVVTTIAGQAGVTGSADNANGLLATFNSPRGITTDNTNLYVADTANRTIRQIVISTGAVTTIAGQAGVTGSADNANGLLATFNSPRSITTDNTNLYVADIANHTIRQIVIATGVVTTLAGTAGSSGSANGTGAAARFNNPYGITTDNTNLYVADAVNHTIRQIVIATGVVTTLAGTAGSSGSADGTGAAARFYYPYDITTDGTNLYMADTGNHTIRKIVIATGVVTTLTGTTGVWGSTDATGTAARFNSPCGVTVSGANLYVADYLNSTIRQVVINTAVVTTFAGTTGAPGTTDGTGTAARFSGAADVTTDGTNLYVLDGTNQTIRKIVISSGVVTTLAGTTGVSGSTDGGLGVARFSGAFAVTTDGTNLYVADTTNNTIRKVVIATGVVTTLAGTAGVAGSTDATGAAARFNGPQGITTDNTNLYVVDTTNNTIRKVVIATGVVTTLVGTAGVTGSTDAAGTAALFNYPYGITNDGANLYVVDSANSTIRKVVIATGVVTTLAGTAGVAGTTDGTGLGMALFNYPNGITTDGTNLYVADTTNNTIRKVVIATGAVTTLAGTGGVPGSTDGTGAAARFRGAAGVITDGTNLYVADTTNNTIRKIQ